MEERFYLKWPAIGFIVLTRRKRLVATDGDLSDVGGQRGAVLAWRSRTPLIRRALRRPYAAAPLAARQNELSVILTSAGLGHLLERTVATLRENLQYDG